MYTRSGSPLSSPTFFPSSRFDGLWLIETYSMREEYRAMNKNHIQHRLKTDSCCCYSNYLRNRKKERLSNWEATKKQQTERVKKEYLAFDGLDLTCSFFGLEPKQKKNKTQNFESNRSIRMIERESSGYQHKTLFTCTHSRSQTNQTHFYCSQLCSQAIETENERIQKKNRRKPIDDWKQFSSQCVIAQRRTNFAIEHICVAEMKFIYLALALSL